jgi:hypothetical protein
MIVRFSTTCPSVADVVLSNGAVASTCTVLVTSPTCSSTSTVTCAWTSRRKTGRLAF